MGINSLTKIKTTLWLLPLLLALSACNKSIMVKDLSVSPNPLTLTSDAQTKNVKVENLLDIRPQNETDIEEEGIYIKNDWIKMTFHKRVNPDVIIVEVNENTSQNSRTYNLGLGSYNYGGTLQIIQEGKSD